MSGTLQLVAEQSIAPAPSVVADEASLLTIVADIGPMVVALSGGVDSALLAVAAHKALGDSMIAVTADSASLANGELDHCSSLAAAHGFSWRTARTDELADERYLVNDTDRCYWCKTALMDQLEPIAQDRSATVVLGVNLDDLDDHRPGQQAAAERGARFPLVEAGYDKQAIRELAKQWGISVWDRPAMPCLSSRLPYGTTVSIPLLGRIDRAEAAMRTLGFEDVRVRHYDETARIEVPVEQLRLASEQAEAIHRSLTQLGYRYVTLDLGGLRSGNLNQGDTENKTTESTSA